MKTKSRLLQRLVHRVLRRRRLFATFAVLSVCGILASSARGADVLIDFDTYPDGSSVPPGPTIGKQWASLGVIFSNSFAVSSSCSLSAPNHVAENPRPLIAFFIDPATGRPGVTDFAGTAQDLCWFPGEGIDMRAYDINGNLIGHVFNSGAGHFASFSFPEPVIARIEMDTILQGIDNFRFSTPVAIEIPPQRCIGAEGSQCAPPVKRNPDGSYTGTVSVGSILHDNCCIINYPNGYVCNNGGSDQSVCKAEWDKAFSNVFTRRGWKVKSGWGPYDEGQGDDITLVPARKSEPQAEFETIATSGLAAPSGTKLDITDEDFCQSKRFRERKRDYGICF